MKNRKLIIPLLVIALSFAVLITMYVMERKSSKFSCAAKVAEAQDINEFMTALKTYCTKEEAAALMNSLQQK